MISWVDERLGDMEVLEEESWAAWCALLAQAYNPPEEPYVASGAGGRILVESSTTYVEQ